MLDVNYIVFKFWNYAWCIGVILMIFRKDSALMFAEVFGMLVQPNLFSIIISSILIYILLPFTIPCSLVNIFKKE